MSQPTPIKLPPPNKKGAMSLEEAIARRRSIRDFSPKPLSLSQLSQILWAAQGLTKSGGGYRATPSAGATYPLEIFVVCGKGSLAEVAAGIYRYDVACHSLTLHYRGDTRLELARAALGEESICSAPLALVICAQFERTAMRYGARADRYVHMEVGHGAQNVYLQATALGLATVAVGAFHDERVREVLQLDKQYRPLYIMPVGKPARD